MKEKSKVFPEFRVKKRTIDKQNDGPSHLAFKQLVLKSHRMSQAKNNNNSLIVNRFQSITRDNKQARSISNSGTHTINLLGPLLPNYTPNPRTLSSINHKLVQTPNIHLWNDLACELKSKTPKKTEWRTLYRNLDSKINGQHCCFKIAKRQTEGGNMFFILLMRFRQKTSVSFTQKQWNKITKVYPTYQEIEESIFLSNDNKIVLPLSLDSESISQHLPHSTSQQNSNQDVL